MIFVVNPACPNLTVSVSLYSFRLSADGHTRELVVVVLIVAIAITVLCNECAGFGIAYRRAHQRPVTMDIGCPLTNVLNMRTQHNTISEPCLRRPRKRLTTNVDLPPGRLVGTLAGDV